MIKKAQLWIDSVEY